MNRLSFLASLRSWREQRQRARALRDIRDCMSSFGYQVDTMDDEIEAACCKLRHVYAHYGATMDEACRALLVLQRL